jgi:hypothetical protein
LAGATFACDAVFVAAGAGYVTAGWVETHFTDTFICWLLVTWLQIMYLMAMEQFMYHTKVTGNYAYYAVAAIHGLHLEYNGQTPSGEQGYVAL